MSFSFRNCFLAPESEQTPLEKGFRNANLASLAADCKKAGGSFYLDSRKATGYAPGSNSPLTSPLVDLANGVGKNLFDAVSEFTVLGAAPVFNGSIFTFTTSGNTTQAIWFALFNASNVIAGGIVQSASGGFSASFTTPSDLTGYNIRLGINGNTLDSKRSYVASKILLPNTTYTVSFRVLTYALNSVTVDNIQLELGPTATAYEPYKKNNVQLTNFAGTTSDGYTKLPILSAAGVGYNFVNLLGDDGNFGLDSNSDGRADGWSMEGIATFTMATNRQKFTPTAINGGITKVAPGGFPASNPGDIYYMCAYIKNASGRGKVQLKYGNSSYSVSTQTPTSSDTLCSVMATIEVGFTSPIMWIFDPSSSGWSVIEVSNAHYLNVSTIFPDPQNRPTKDQMDVIVQSAIAKYGYINTRILKIAWMDFLCADGTDSYGVIANNGSLDFVGTSDFAFAGCFVTPSTISPGRLINKNGTVWSETQYALFQNTDGTLYLVYNGSNMVAVAPAKSVTPNKLYTFKLIRKSGNLKFYLNDALVYNSAFSASIVTQPNIRLFCCASGSSGGDWFKGYMSILSAFGSTVDETKFNAFCTKAFRDYLPPA